MVQAASNPPTPTGRLCVKLAGVSLTALPDRVVDSARLRIVDTLATVVAGAGMAMNQPYRSAVGRLSPPGQFLIPGIDRALPLESAAEAMAALGHSTECDDGYRLGSVHPGIVVIPPTVLLAIEQRAHLGQLIEAVVAGYEACGLVAQAVHPVSRQRGFHNTGIAGVIGAAAASARLLALDAERTEAALGLAASGACGLFAFLHGGGDTKKLHAGHAAREGLRAARLAADGLDGPRDVLEGRDGFLQAFGGGTELDDGESGWVIERCYTKPYACCRHLHPALDAARDALRALDTPAGTIERVEVETYAIAAEHAHVPWTTPSQAQLSFGYCLAVGLLRGGIVPADMETAMREDPDVNRLAERVAVRTEPSLDRAYPRTRPARVTIRLADGRSVARSVDDPRGSPTNPLTRDELADKTRQLCSGPAGNRKADALWTEVAEGCLDKPVTLSLVRPQGGQVPWFL